MSQELNGSNVHPRILKKNQQIQSISDIGQTIFVNPLDNQTFMINKNLFQPINNDNFASNREINSSMRRALIDMSTNKPASIPSLTSSAHNAFRMKKNISQNITNNELSGKLQDLQINRKLRSTRDTNTNRRRITDNTLTFPTRGRLAPNIQHILTPSEERKKLSELKINNHLRAYIPTNPFSTGSITTASNTRSTNCSPVDCSMCVKNSNQNLLRFNLASSVFDSNFNSKAIEMVSMVRNLDGSVDFSVVFNPASDTYSSYPQNPAYDKFILPYN